MKRALTIAAVIVAAALRCAAADAPAGWTLAWADEFDQPGLPDATKWDYDVGGHGWGNRELQFYTKARTENARVEDGHLVIEARREKFEDRDYTSARLITRGRADWKHGRIEVRARLPMGRGTWPAIWLLPTVWNLGDGQWPDNGEIDVMEHVGHDPGVIHASTHTHLHQWRKGTQRTATRTLPDVGSVFHTYVMEWDEGVIRVGIDDDFYFTSRQDGGDWQSWPFERPFYLLLNLAIGGDWGGEKGVDAAAFPQRMEVDFVRVYRRAAP